MKEKRGEKGKREKLKNEMVTDIRVEFGGIRKKKEGKRGSKQERKKELDRVR